MLTKFSNLIQGPICECGDDDFSDDWDAEDFTRGEDGECLPVVSPVINGTIEAGDCSTFGYAWTTALSKDTPAGDGDFEYFHQFSLSEACANPTGIRATALDGQSSSWPVHIDLLMGFWCVNSEQTNGTCQDFAVQFCCPKEATGDCTADGYEWSEWYNVDDPGWC